MSLSITWWEHDDALRVDDSLRDEVEAFYGSDAKVLLNHPEFGALFQVECEMLIEFEHSDGEITSWTYSIYDLPLKHVLELLVRRRQILDSISQKLEHRLATAVKQVLEPTKLSALSSQFLNSSVDLEQPIMIQYLNYVLPRFGAEERIDPNFYCDGLGGFEQYIFTPQLA
jgi:hypothetical protein